MRDLHLELSKLEEKLDILIAEKTSNKYVQMVEDEIIEVLRLIKEQDEQNTITL